MIGVKNRWNFPADIRGTAKLVIPQSSVRVTSFTLHKATNNRCKAEYVLVIYL